MSRTYIKESSLWLDAPIDDVFAFFSKAENLQRVTPDWFSLEITTPGRIEMRVGTLIDYRLKVHHVPLRWRTRIDQWDPPRVFADTQLKGPYKRWYHTHTFESERGGTRCGDRVEYQVPGGPLSPIIHKLMVKPDVDTIFEYRREQLVKIFGGDNSASEQETR